MLALHYCAFSAAGQEMYQAQAAESEASGDDEAPDDEPDEGEDADADASEDEDVVEADYEIVDEEK